MTESHFIGTYWRWPGRKKGSPRQSSATVPASPLNTRRIIPPADEMRKTTTDRDPGATQRRVSPQAGQLSEVSWAAAPQRTRALHGAPQPPAHLSARPPTLSNLRQKARILRATVRCLYTHRCRRRRYPTSVQRHPGDPLEARAHPPRRTSAEPRSLPPADRGRRHGRRRERPRGTPRHQLPMAEAGADPCAPRKTSRRELRPVRKITAKLALKIFRNGPDWERACNPPQEFSRVDVQNLQTIPAIVANRHRRP